MIRPWKYFRRKTVINKSYKQYGIPNCMLQNTTIFTFNTIKTKPNSRKLHGKNLSLHRIVSFTRAWVRCK